MAPAVQTDRHVGLVVSEERLAAVGRPIVVVGDQPADERADYPVIVGARCLVYDCVEVVALLVVEHPFAYRVVGAQGRLNDSADLVERDSFAAGV